VLRNVRNQAAHWISFGIADSPLREQLKHLQTLIMRRRSYRLTVAKFFDGQQLSSLEILQAVMLAILKSGKEWDWSKKGDFKGLGGRGGALEISKQVTAKLQDEERMSTKQLFESIMAGA
jgi:hypothetical protein